MSPVSPARPPPPVLQSDVTTVAANAWKPVPGSALPSPACGAIALTPDRPMKYRSPRPSLHRAQNFPCALLAQWNRVFIVEWGEGVGEDVRKRGKPQGTELQRPASRLQKGTAGKSRATGGDPESWTPEGRVAGLPFPLLFRQHCTLLRIPCFLLPENSAAPLPRPAPWLRR